MTLRLALAAVVMIALTGCGGDPAGSANEEPGIRSTAVEPAGAVAQSVASERAMPAGANATTPAAASPPPTPAPTRAQLVARLKPSIVQTPIAFGRKRRAEMRAYSERHYGQATAALKSPKVVVLHYTVTPTFRAAFDIFDADAPDVELGERPGVCAHFLIDRDGTIHQLVPLSLRCRHTVGLNWTAIGIEHVGSTDADVVDRPAVRRASLRLVRWLRCRYGIHRSDVIGHAESLGSPFHREDVARLRTQTHADMQPAAMKRYRGLIEACPVEP